MRIVAKVLQRAAVSALLTSLTAAPAQAGSSEQDNEWHFEITPYLFGIGMQGTTGVRDVTADIDADVADLLERQDSAEITCRSKRSR